MKSGVENRKVLTAMMSVGFFAIFATTMSKNPVLPLFIKALNGTDAIIGIIAAISPIAGIVFSFPVGFLADRMGKKRILMIAGIIFLIAPLLYLLVSNAWWLIPIRFFHGMATAILGPVASAIICDEYAETKGEKLGLYSSATLIGRTIAPIVGGGIITALMFLKNGLQYKAVYLAAFIISIPAFILILTLRQKNESSPSLSKISLGEFFLSLKTFLSNARLFSTSLVDMAIYFAFGAFETYLPVYLSAKGVPAYQIGIVFSIQVLSLALSKPLFGKLSDTFDRRAQIIIGIGIIAVSIVCIPFFSNLIVVSFISVVFGLGMALATVATSTYAADVSKREHLGASMGALSSIMDIGHSSGPFIAGLVITLYSYTAGFAACAALCVLCGIIFAFAAFRDAAPVSRN